MTAKRWNMAELKDIFDRHAADIAPIYDAHPEIIGIGMNVDRDTNQPFAFIVVPESSQPAAGFPARVGPPGDELEIRVEYRPRAHLC